ncbi:hypothetical protein LZK73_25420 (plasmid) [Neorhizobium galegae]|nr:hypothetical protein LZK73_25420 [Neorhizobium galegae]
MATQLEMVKLFSEQLKLCKMKPDETVIILCEDDIRADYAAAFMLAAREARRNAIPDHAAAARQTLGQADDGQECTRRKSSCH